MEDKSERIKTAYAFLSSEIQRKRLAGVDFRIFERDWIKIRLLREGRSLWLGYKAGLGYFISWDKNEASHHYFDLNDDTVSNILGLLPSSTTEIGTAWNNKNPGRELFDSINDSSPDPERIRKILEEAPSTEEGIDVLATVASIKSFRSAIEKLRSLIESQHELKHAEVEYHKILALNPWMLGSQYTELLVEEFELDKHSRIDLMLASAIGHVDVIELKRPDTKILFGGSRPNTWRASFDLSDAQAQARKYLQIIDEDRLRIETEHPFDKQSVSRLYRSGVIIVAGRTPKERGALNALRDINVSERRMLVITYDDVLAIAEATIRIFERKLRRKS